ncbi:hypothetical protein [Catenovulum adriaticum]|uniref:DUF4178 domain-containing protein n=1 Tax=Catenovulum adriaticum TaxID=2984846 RepID=A0ABY7ALB1_9ALTE|nr:hypothetical protein [Catenovulum sp. TS8]WAJ70338.1 hypothetical protein OLW01_00540 [Catenovulum sp. TS8]
MGFFSRWFSNKDKQKTVRDVSHPKSLKIADIITFSDSFALPELLRKQSFRVEKIHTYQFEHSGYTEFVLLGQSNKQVYLAVMQDDEEWLNVSIKIDHDEVSGLFDLEQFSDIFDEDTNTELALQNEQNEFANWVSPVYFQRHFAQRGYFYSQDFRPSRPPIEEGDDSEALDYFQLTSSDESFSVEIEVWQDGDTDVLLTLHLPIHDIVEMYPGDVSDS